MPPNPTDPKQPFVSPPISPDLLARARQTLDVEQCLEEMRQLEAEGGFSPESFLAELERLVLSS